MSQRHPVMIQASVLWAILVIAISSAKADSPHTFGHAASEAGFDFDTTDLDLSMFGLGGNTIESLDGVEDYISAEHIDLFNNKITSIPSGQFLELSDLETLNLGNNQITSIPADGFVGLEGLQELSLPFNQITRIPSNAFSELSGLQSLSLALNRITTIPSAAFSKLSGLQNLYLTFNQITSIPSGVFFGLTDLQNLDLGYNQITSIASDAFSGLSGLQSLYLRNNQITQLNLSGATFRNLKEFRVRDRNTISSVDLSKATLSQTAFDVIAEDLDNGGVFVLDLTGADLSLVTSYEAIADWDDLQTIDLSFATLGSNEVDFLTDNLAGLNDLTVSRGQWDGFSQTTQGALSVWDAIEGNTLTVPEPTSLALALLGLGAVLGVRQRKKS